MSPTALRSRESTSAPAARGMAPNSMAPSGISVLAAEISAACFEPPAVQSERIKAALARAAADARLLSPEQRETAPDRYARHVIYSDPAGRFTVLAIVWGPNQFSPSHAHHTWCAYAVHEGVLEETLYRWDEASATAKPTGTQVRRPGYSCHAGAGLDQIHRLGNSGEKPAISIHVYGVERERISTGVNNCVESA